MKNLLKISEFAVLSGISRKLLIFYDNHDILHPKWTDPENGYRYYSYRQIDTANVIVSFRGAGVPLECIRQYLGEKSPEHLLELLNRQERSLSQQIRALQQIRGMVQARKTQTEQGMASRAGELLVQELPAENLFLGPKLPDDYRLEDGWDYLPAFYTACMEQGGQLGFPVGTLVDQQNLRKGLWNKPSRYFYRLPDGQYPDYYTTPAGLYAIGTAYTDYGHTDFLYQKISSYIAGYNLRICGNAYEEFLIDEIAEANPDRYLLRIAIQVEELERGPSRNPALSKRAPGHS